MREDRTRVGEIQPGLVINAVCRELLYRLPTRQPKRNIPLRKIDNPKLGLKHKHRKPKEPFKTVQERRTRRVYLGRR